MPYEGTGRVCIRGMNLGGAGFGYRVRKDPFWFRYICHEMD
jgi:hypothetical protein